MVPSISLSLTVPIGFCFVSTVCKKAPVAVASCALDVASLKTPDAEPSVSSQVKQLPGPYSCHRQAMAEADFPQEENLIIVTLWSVVLEYSSNAAHHCWRKIT